MLVSKGFLGIRGDEEMYCVLRIAYLEVDTQYAIRNSCYEAICSTAAISAYGVR